MSDTSDFEKQREAQHMDPDSNEPWQIVKQTEGLDADETRKVAGPDWEPGTQGDLDADTSPQGGAGSSGSGGSPNQNAETERTL